MKNLLGLLFIFALSLPLSNSLQGQNKTLNNFYRQHKKGKEVKNFILPGFLLKIGGKIGRKHVEEEEGKIALKLMKYMKNARIMISEEMQHIPAKEINHLVEKLRQDDFEDWILVRESETNVNIMAREEKGKIKNLLFLVQDETDFVFLSLKSKLPKDELGKVIGEIIQTSIKKELNLPEVEEPKPKEEPVTKPIA